MNLGLIFAYCILSVIQIIILISLGFSKKLLPPTSAVYLNKLVFNFFIPIYAIIEISKVVSIQNLQLFWVIMINCLLAWILSFILALSTSYLIDIDVRIRYDFTFVLALPALGSFPLVLGKVLCYPGGPLDGDTYCKDIIGLMMLNLIVFVIVTFAVALPLMNLDRNVGNTVQEKLQYIWHIFLAKNKIEKDFGALYFIKKFVKKDKESERIFEEFRLRNNLEVDFDKLLYRNVLGKDFKCLEVDVIDNGDKQLVVYKEGRRGEVNVNRNEKSFKNFKNLLNFDFESENENGQIFQRNYSLKNLASEHIILNKLPFFHNKINKIHNDINFKSASPQTWLNISNRLNQTDIYNNNNNKDDILTLNNNNNNNHKQLKQPHRTKSSTRFDRLELADVLDRESPDHLPLITYYNNLFDLIKQNTNIEHHSLIHRDQTEVINNITVEDVPIFPIVEGTFSFNKSLLSLFNKEWEKFEQKTIEHQKKINLKFKPVQTSLTQILSVAINPPLIGGLIGMLFGLSKLKEILFDPRNFYLSTNIAGHIALITQSFVPLYFTNIGHSIMMVKGFHLKMLIRKKEMIISLLFRAFVVPFIGIGVIFFWRSVYGGIVAESKLVRFALFMPFCLPSSPYTMIIANLINFMKEEVGLFQFGHNLFMFVSQTTMMLVYFVIMESSGGSVSQ